MSSINSTSSSSANKLRITGMATGLDTDTTVKQMLAGENAKLDKMKQDRQYVEWRQEALRDVIKDFRDLRTSYLLIDSPSDTNMIKSGAYSGATITPSSDAMTATALPGAVIGTSKVEVTQIAKSAKLEGINLNKNSASILSGGIFNEADWNGETIKFTLNGTQYTTGSIAGVLADKSNLESKIQDAINSVSGLNGKVSVEVNTVSDTISFNSLTDNNIRVDGSAIPELADVKVINPTTSTLLSDLGITVDTPISIFLGTIESDTITLKSTDTLLEAINKIYNVKSDKTDTSSTAKTLYSDIQVSFSELTRSLTIQTRNTGSSQSIKISSSVLGLTSQVPTTLNGGLGQDAKVAITPPGSIVPTTVTKSSNNFTIDNVTYNLVKDPNGVSYTVDLTTSADAQKSVDKIKAFIDKYNALVDKITTKLGEKKNYDYKPLTDSQKEGMEDDDIEVWEEKAKKGILKNDGDLQKILQDMRNGFMSTVKSAGISLAEIGIETYGGYEAASKSGQLEVDQTKLKKALEERGDQVMKLFTAFAPTTDLTDAEGIAKGYDITDSKWQDKYKYDNTGIFQRIEDMLYNAAQKSDGALLQKAGYAGTVSELTNAITKQLQEKDKAIEVMNDRIYDKQERYYQMFAKLEAAMNQLNSQQSWLTQSLSG